MSEPEDGLEIIDERTTGFSMIQNDVCDKFGAIIGPYAAVVYLSLCRYVNREIRNAWPSHQTIADNWRISVSTVKKAIDVLTAAGMIRVEHRYRPDGGRASNRYFLRNLPDIDSIVAGPHSRQTARPQPPKTQGLAVKRLSEQYTLNNIKEKKKPPRRTSVTQAVEMGFDLNGQPPVKKFHQRSAEILYDGLMKHRKIMSNEPPNLKDWAETFRLFTVCNDIAPEELEVRVQWYATKGLPLIATDFIPQAYSAELFCQKYVQISDSRDRVLAAAKKQAERNGHPSDDQPVIDMPKTRDAGTMSHEDYMKLIGVDQ